MHSLYRELAKVLTVMCFTLLLPLSARSEEFSFASDSPERQGMSLRKLDEMRQAMAKETNALLVIRNDRLIYEWYAEGQDPQAKHYTASLAKAVIGGMSFAAAMDQGLINLDDPAWKYVPQWRDDPVRSAITMRHLGSHTSGIADAHDSNVSTKEPRHNEYPGWEGDFWRWRQGKQAPPQDAFSISRDIAPVLFEPGSKFQYSNPGLAMLGYCVTASLRDSPWKDLRTLLRERVMQPIGIENSDWSCGYGLTEVVDGLPLVANWGGGGFTPRALARLGRLVLKQGDWQGKTILSSASVEAMVNDAGLPGHLGMGWWTNADGHFPELPKDAVWGAGAGHQILLVIPSLQMIVIRNGGRLPSDPATSVEATSSDPFYVHIFRPLMAAIIDPGTITEKAQAPYPASSIVEGLEFDFSKHERLAPGSDNWPTTWGADGHLYTSWGDGGGFGGTNSRGRVALGVARVEGEPQRLKTANVWGGVNAENAVQFEGKSYGLLSVDGTLYMWVACQPHAHSDACRIARSTDDGAHWTLSEWQFTYADQLTIPTFLNFGQDYGGARDEYVYSYYIHPTWGPQRTESGNYGFDVHRPGRIYLSRVHKTQIMEQQAYEFFAGFDEDGPPLWTKDLGKKKPVFVDPNGVGWNLSVVYAPAIQRYLLCTEHSETHKSKLGVFDAPAPWGPWTTVAYEETFGENAIEQSCFYWSFPSPWLTSEGRFTMAFTGKNTNDSWNTVPGKFCLKQPDVGQGSRTAPVPKSPVIRGIDWAPSSEILRSAQGSDNWPLTWGDDDLLYTCYGDGNGFHPFSRRKLSLGFASIAGDPPDVRGVNIPSPSGEALGDGKHGRKASGILMVDGTLYLLIRNVNNAQLGWSTDHARTWNWCDWKFDVSFGSPTFLNFGRNYSGARDDYVYLFSSDTEEAYGAGDQMVMCRVPKEQLRIREAYQFFAGLDAQGQPLWSDQIGHRQDVLRHEGRTYRSGISYNAGLKRYLWCQIFPESTHPHGPRFQGGFGVFDAPEPWGPWTTAYFTNDWDVGPGETASFPPKWMSHDGRTVHLVFSGDDCFSIRRAELQLQE